jgi:hypothetical protein
VHGGPWALANHSRCPALTWVHAAARLRWKMAASRPGEGGYDGGSPARSGQGRRWLIPVALTSLGRKDRRSDSAFKLKGERHPAGRNGDVRRGKLRPAQVKQLAARRDSPLKGDGSVAALH